MSRFIFCIYCSVLMGLAGLSDEALGASTIGNTTVVVKTVTGTLSETQRSLAFRDDIYHNEVIETFEESATEITFLDETTMSLGPNTQLTLDRFVYDPDPENSAFVLTITEGALRFASGVLPSQAYKIHTPVATIGIRGTVIDIVIDRVAGADGTILTNVNLTVVEGEADFVNCRGEGTRVPAGMSSSIGGTAIACSDPTVPGPQPQEVTHALRIRDRLLAD